jgi:hypothetical protein
MDSDVSFITEFLLGLSFSLFCISIISLFFYDVGLIAFMLKVMFFVSLILAWVSCYDDSIFGVNEI